MNLKKELSGVAKVAAQIMGEQLKGQQHQIDKNKNNKIDAHDFKLLRAKKEVKKEEVDLQEKSDDYEVKQSKTDPDVHHVHYKGKKIGYVYGNKKDMWGHEYHAMGTGDDGYSSKREAVSALKADHKHHISGAYMKEEVEQEEEKSMTFSEMLAAYKEHGLAVIAEEPTEDEFNAEIKKAQAKSEGKEKADVAKAAVQAVKQEEIEVLDADVINGVEEVTIDERTLTEPESKKKEEIVKSMKKKMSGFKERYGERAKNVMYATATKMAKKD